MPAVISMPYPSLLPAYASALALTPEIGGRENGFLPGCDRAGAHTRGKQSQKNNFPNTRASSGLAILLLLLKLTIEVKYILVSKVLSYSSFLTDNEQFSSDATRFWIWRSSHVPHAGRGTMVQTDRGVTLVSLHHRSSSSMRYVGRAPYRIPMADTQLTGNASPTRNDGAN